jgi:tRNA nucleotidyltransferase (CCA-adding enzyme)
MNVNIKETEIREVCEKVLDKIVPNGQKREQIRRFTKHLNNRVTKKLQNAGISAEISVQGSIAKDTWLAGDKDIDVFIILPKSTREVFQRVLEVIKTMVQDYVIAYAEHPYLKATIEDYEIDFVPSFQIQNAKEIVSSVDRTPLHTSYIKEKLNQETQNEVRLLKQFMRGIGIYGAEIKVQGFSGYLCELLILKYQSFIQTLMKFSEWQGSNVIDVENLYKGQYTEIKKKLNAPLIVIDPIDSVRNVAAAVSQENLGEFIITSRTFLENPQISFFFPPPRKPLSTSALNTKLSHLDFELIILLFQSKVIIPDILWGQLYKSLRIIRRLLIQYDFDVLKSKAWSNEKGTNALLFGLGSRYQSQTKKHVGPPSMSKEVTQFLTKYVAAESTVLDPWLEGSRWVVGVKRRYVDAVSLLNEKLHDSKAVGIPKQFVDDFKVSLQIKVNEEIMEYITLNKELATFVSDFLVGRPKWLR